MLLTLLFELCVAITILQKNLCFFLVGECSKMDIEEEDEMFNQLAVNDSSYYFGPSVTPTNVSLAEFNEQAADCHLVTQDDFKAGLFLSSSPGENILPWWPKFSPLFFSSQKTLHLESLKRVSSGSLLLPPCWPLLDILHISLWRLPVTCYKCLTYAI